MKYLSSSKRHSNIIEAFQKLSITEEDLIETFTSGSTKGGQHANKNSTCVSLTHVPTGITILISGRNQYQNRILAREKLIEKIQELQEEEKERIPTKPTRESNEKRLEEKKKNSEKKRRRKLCLYCI